MSDRQVWHEQGPQPQDWSYTQGVEASSNDPARQVSDYVAFCEREQAHEDTPLNLTRKQKSRLWLILEHECGPVAALRILKRIEAEA